MTEASWGQRLAVLAWWTVFSAIAAATVVMIWNDRPADSQSAPTPGVGYTHADLVDDPCPTSNPSCTDHRNQKVPMDWWYPITDTSGLFPASFKFSDGAGTIYGSHPMTGVRDGGANRIPGPSPIIVFSHGTAGHGIQNLSMYQHLASRGFIVAAPTHRGNSLIDVGLGLPIDGFALTINKRNLDLKFTLNITHAVFGSTGKVKMDSSGDPYAIAIGHSLGAMTALTMPTGLNPFLLPDQRFDAVVGISSSVYLFDVAGIDSQALLSSLNKPVLLIDQRADGITPSQFTDRVEAEILTPDSQPVVPVDRLNLSGAEHNATTDVLALKVSLDASTAPQAAKDAVTGLTDQVCADPANDCVRKVHEMQNGAVSGFAWSVVPV